MRLGGRGGGVGGEVVVGKWGQLYLSNNKKKKEKKLESKEDKKEGRQKNDVRK